MDIIQQKTQDLNILLQGFFTKFETDFSCAPHPSNLDLNSNFVLQNVDPMNAQENLTKL